MAKKLSMESEQYKATRSFLLRAQKETDRADDSLIEDDYLSARLQIEQALATLNAALREVQDFISNPTGKTSEQGED